MIFKRIEKWKQNIATYQINSIFKTQHQRRVLKKSKVDL